MGCSTEAYPDGTTSFAASAADNGDFPFAQPGQAGCVETRTVQRLRVRPFRETPFPPSRADQERVAPLDAHALRFLGGLQHRGKNGITRVQPVPLLEPRDVEQPHHG